MFASKNRFLTNAVASSGYSVTKSLRFRASASAGLSRTFTSSTNPTLFTYSFWWKRGILGTQTVLFGENASTQNGLLTQTADNISWYVNNAIVWTTTAVFRDPSAWYHLVLVINGTAITLYSNGVQVATGTATNTRINTAILHSIGRNSSGSIPTDGYMTEIYLIDGQALTPSSFGAIDANGVWSPIQYTGTYGTNGFYLKFTDSSAATFSNLGADYSAGSYSSDLRSLGTNIGGMTTGGGLSSAFDGIYAQAVGSCAQTAAVSGLVTANSVGKDWGAGVTKTITAFRITAPTNEGFCSSGTARQIKLQGSTDNFSSSIVDLYSFTPAYKVADQQTITSGITTSTAYRYHRIVIDGNGVNSVLLAEVEFYESGSYGINSWMPNNISVTAGTTYDSMIDSPTNAASGTQPVGNYCVLNPIDKAAAASWTNGNLSYSQPTGVGGVKGTFGVSSGKWYWEVIPTANGQIIGMCPITVAGQTADFTTAQGAYGYYWTNGNKYVNGVSSAYGASYAINDVIGVALDLTALTITFYKNNVSQGAITGVPAGTYCAGITNASGITTTGNINFGQRPFSYSPPSGHQALCTANLTTPTIKNGAQYMAATTYTGTGATLSITNTVNSTSFKPDLVWTKSRSAIAVNKLTDSVRGVTNAFISNSTAAQTTDVNGVTAFNSNGFTVGTDTNYNTNAATYIGWQWLCNAGTTSSNTNGSITSTVQVNTTAGFSILTYTGTGASATVGHGLGIAPSAILIKRYSAATGPFNFWHTSLPTPTTQLLTINTSSSIFTNAAYWNSTLPSSTVFSVGTTTNNNASAGIYLAYCFAAITGYSAFGSYVGNASTDGPFVYCGFRPRYVLVTLADVTNADNTYVIDTSRNPYNVAQNLLVTDSSAAESTAVCIDILSNGFKCKSATMVNTTGLRYLYMAFAENPFNYSRAR